MSQISSEIDSTPKGELSDFDHELQAAEIEARKEQKSTIIGVLLMVFSGFIFSVVAALFQWGSVLGYQSMQLVMTRAVLQSFFGLFFGLTRFSKPVYTQSSSLSLSGTSIDSTQVEQNTIQMVTQNDSQSQSLSKISKHFENTKCCIHLKVQQFKKLGCAINVTPITLIINDTK